MNDATNISELGEAIYPHLNKPDVKFNENGEYKLTLKIPEAKAKGMISIYEKAIQNSISDAEQKLNGKKVKIAPKPYSIENGFALFKYKMKATGINRKTKEPFSQRPALFDAKKNEEKMFFSLDFPREKRYYYAVPQTMLEEDENLMAIIQKQVKDAVEHDRMKDGYAVYSTQYDQPYVYCEGYSTLIQKNPAS